MEPSKVKNILSKIAGVLLSIFIVIQFIPYGHDHHNPPVVKEMTFDSPLTKELFRRSCMDCHSNETVWPWYSHVAPVSWFVYNHVKDGRANFNISMSGVQNRNEADEASREYREGEMPIKSYLLLHPKAKLDAQERKNFLQGLIASFGEAKDEN